MKFRRTIAVLLALVFALAAAPTGAEKAEQAPVTKKGNIIAESREPDQAMLDAIIDYNTRANAMKKRCEELVTKSDDPDYGEARLLVYCEEKPDLTGALDCVQGYDGRWLVQYPSAEEAQAAFKRLNADKRVSNVFPDLIMSVTHELGEPDYVSYGYDYYHADLTSYEDWLAANSDGFYQNTIAVIDTGVAGAHPLFSGLMTTGYDFVNGDNDATDDNGHGTHVAGIIAQADPYIYIMPLKVLAANGKGNTDNILSAVDYAVASGCSVMNLSLSSHTSDPSTDEEWQNAKASYETKIANAFDSGTIVVVAAGNDGSSVANNIPASVERAFTVGGHNPSFGWYSNSNRGSEVDLTAAATNVFSANYLYGNSGEDMYVSMTGTSMATPHVSAACALVRTRYRYIDADAVVEMIKACTRPNNLTGGGTGALSIANLVRQLSESAIPHSLAGSSVDSALTTNTSIHFVSQGDYPVFAETSNGTTYVRSGNAGRANSVSALTVTLYMTGGSQFSFEYSYESESNWDFFEFYSNGELLERMSGSHPSFTSTSYTLSGSGTITLSWVFRKDGSNNSGFDGFKLRNLRFSGTAPTYCAYSSSTPTPGDMYYLNRAANGLQQRMFMTSVGDHRFAAVNPTGLPSYVKSGNTGVHSSVSTLKFTIRLSAGETLTCRFAVSSEAVFDVLEGQVNGTQRLYISGESGWRSFSYTASSTAYYNFVFTYTKDVSNSQGQDCAMLDSVKIGSQVGLSDALNYTANGIDFTTSQNYPFFVDYYLSDDVGVSGNGGVNGSESWVKCTIPMEAGDTLSFEYYYSTEQNYDLFKFKANGSSVFTRSGQDNAWHVYEFTAYTSGLFTFEWIYTKDSSNSRGYDCVAIDNVRYMATSEQTYSLDYSLNVPGGDLHFTPSRFWADYWYEDTVGTSANYGENSTESSVTTTVYMNPGDQLSFEYFVSSEEDYDWYTFSANGTRIQSLSGDLGWATYVFTATEGRDYTFVWKYTKDSSQSSFMDVFKLDNVELTSNDYDLEVINDDDSAAWLGFTSTGDYPFRAYRESNGTYFARSTNDGEDASESSMSTLITLSAGDEISFYYIVSSEEFYDEFRFLANGSIVLRNSGETGIQYFSYIAPATRQYTFTWSYVKDNDRSMGDDMVKVMAVKVRKGVALLPGDADRNGTVDTTDALIILRCALGISGSPAEFLSNCDMDSNGVIDTTDALIILRIALGLG